MQAWSETTYGVMLIQMGWFPLLVLIVFGMVSIAFMVQMPKEKPRHNIKRVIRGTGADPEHVEPVEDPVETKPETSQKKWNISHSVPETVVSIVTYEEEHINEELFSQYGTKKMEWLSVV